jgi:hypothetical protein
MYTALVVIWKLSEDNIFCRSKKFIVFIFFLFPRKTLWDPFLFHGISGWGVSQLLATIAAGNPARLGQTQTGDLKGNSALKQSVQTD